MATMKKSFIVKRIYPKFHVTSTGLGMEITKSMARAILKAPFVALEDNEIK